MAFKRVLSCRSELTGSVKWPSRAHDDANAAPPASSTTICRRRAIDLDDFCRVGRNQSLGSGPDPIRDYLVNLDYNHDEFS
jgi:hypothetical protein